MAVKAKFYSVAVGRKTGIFSSWGECVTQTKGFSSAKYKSFTSKEAAQQFIDDHAKNNSSKPKSNSKRANCSSDVAVEDRKSSSTSAKKRKFYAVASGRTQGIYNSWDECQSEIKRYSRPVFKSFTTKEGADDFVNQYNSEQEKKKRKINDGEDNGSPPSPPSISLLVQVHFDGGSRGNPGISGAGVQVIVSKDGVERNRTNIRHYCGNNSTNNVAEYTGLLLGLEETKSVVEEFTKKLCESEHESNQWYSIDVIINGDSNLIMDQINGYSTCKNKNLHVIYMKCKKLITLIKDVSKMKLIHCKSSSDSQFIFVKLSLEHVYRKDNTIADGLANEAMDEKKSWTTHDEVNSPKDTHYV